MVAYLTAARDRLAAAPDAEREAAAREHVIGMGDDSRGDLRVGMRRYGGDLRCGDQRHVRNPP